MKHTNPELGYLGAKFFAYAQMRELNTVRLGELQKPLGLTFLQERRLLERLNNDGYLFRLQRGIYIVPQKLTAGGYWRPNDYYIAAKYMELHKASYYIGGLTAFNQHGFSTQIPNQLVVYNNKISGLKIFKHLAIRFIKTTTHRIIGFDAQPIPAWHQTVNIANLERTILDAINDWKRYQTLPQAYVWLKKYYRNKIFLKNFVRLTEKSANYNAIRRIGFYLEQLGVHSTVLSSLYKKLNPTNSWTLLIPNNHHQGKTDKKWRIIDNVN